MREPGRTLVRSVAALLPLVTCAILAGFRDSITAATAALVLVLWVVAAAASGDRVAGVLAALSGGIWFDFFLTEPYQRFTISDPDDVEVTVLLVVIGVAVNEIALWGRRQQAGAARRSGYLEGVVEHREGGGRRRHTPVCPDRPGGASDHRGARRLLVPLRARSRTRQPHSRFSTTTAWSPEARGLWTSTGVDSP